MSLAHLAIRKTDDFPLRRVGTVHTGKVRSVYWLSPTDSRRIAAQRNYAVPEDTMLGVMVISDQALGANQILADTKFEFGYVANQPGAESQLFMVYIDEVGTLDSSRYWDLNAYREGKLVENSKERFRKMLCDAVPDKDVLLNKDRMAERGPLGETFRVPVDAMMAIGELYRDIAERLTGAPVPRVEHARQEILDALAPYGIVQ